MLRTLSLLWFLSFTLVANAAPQTTVPKKIVAQYEVTRKGKPFANVVETFTQSNGKYHIESIMTGVGVYALLGERKLSSEGTINSKGLQPKHFEQHQGDIARKTRIADFDWKNKTISMKAKGKVRTGTLQSNTQDLLSYAYQWVITPPSADNKIHLTTGKKLRTFEYKIADKNKTINTPAGKFKTVYLVEQTKADKKKAKEKKQLWLAVDQQYLVVRLILQDKRGNTLEQNLTRLDIE